MFDWVFNTSLPALHIMCYILELRITTRNLLLALDPSQQSSSPFSPNFIYINHLQVVVTYLPPFINHLKITLKVLLKQKSKHLIVQCLSQHPLRASTWSEKWRHGIPNSQNKFLQRHSFLSCTFRIQFYFIGKRQRKSIKNLTKTCHGKVIFVI